MPPAPNFQFDQMEYTAKVCCQRCPGYTRPFGAEPRGHATETFFLKGEVVRLIREEPQSRLFGYVSCEVEAPTGGTVWINVWCQYDRRDNATGVNFCQIRGQPLQRAARAG